jgi:hypothetical protein
MIKETKSILYSMRLDVSLHKAIQSGATMQNIKRSEYIRSILMDKIGQIGQPCDNQFSADNVKIA